MHRPLQPCANILARRNKIHSQSVAGTNPTGESHRGDNIDGAVVRGIHHMKLLPSILALLLLLAGGPAVAQLAPGNAAGVATGHIHLTVSDVAKAESIWLSFGAKEITSGRLQAL